MSLSPSELEGLLGGPQVRAFSAKIGADSLEADRLDQRRELPPAPFPIPALRSSTRSATATCCGSSGRCSTWCGTRSIYARAVWASLTPEERVVMLEAYTIGLPEDGLPPGALNDPSQHVPLLNCIANEVLGFYGNCMVMPFSIPAALATRLAGGRAGRVIRRRRSRPAPSRTR